MPLINNVLFEMIAKQAGRPMEIIHLSGTSTLSNYGDPTSVWASGDWIKVFTPRDSKTLSFEEEGRVTEGILNLLVSSGANPLLVGDKLRPTGCGHNSGSDYEVIDWSPVHIGEEPIFKKITAQAEKYKGP